MMREMSTEIPGMIYVLYIEFDGDVPIVSAHASIPKAAAAWRKFCAEFPAYRDKPLPRRDLIMHFVKNHRMVDCRMFACPPRRQRGG